MVRNLLHRFTRSASSSPRATVHDESGNIIVPFLSGAELLDDRNRQVLISRIAALVSVPQPHFREFYVGTLEAFATFVQQLPASEAHHHAGLGGLLNHSLEVAEKALALRRGYLLPPNADPSVVSRQADLWSYAVFSAALYHDVGKAVIDQAVYRFDARRRPLGLWNPWRGPMTDTDYYRVTFVRDRQYSRHALVGPFVARTIMPDTAIEWLGSEREVIAAWIACVAGTAEIAGPLTTIVANADSLSANENLGAGEARIPSATQVPLHEKLVTALRALLDNGQLTLNRPGAAGFVTNTDLWLVSKRGLDLIRDYLIDHGHVGVPSQNDRLMDELQQFGVCVPNGERAIWRARIKLPDFDHELTLLRFPVTTLWPDAANRPPPLNGTVEVNGTGASAAPNTSMHSTPIADSTDLVVPPIAAPEVVEELDASSAPGSAAATLKTQNDNDISEDNEPDGFMTWLRERLQAGTFEINTPDAVVHVVPEGLLLVSPRTFKQYIGADGDWHHVQKRFFRGRFHRRNAERTNIIHYKVQGKRRSGLIKGVLIPDPQRVLRVDLPAPNKHLVLQTKL